MTEYRWTDRVTTVASCPDCYPPRLNFGSEPLICEHGVVLPPQTGEPVTVIWNDETQGEGER